MKSPAMLTVVGLVFAVAIGCERPRPPADRVTIEFDGERFTGQQLVVELLQTRQKLAIAEARLNDKGPQVCRCETCRCDVEATLNQIGPGWYRRCMCATSENRPAPEPGTLELIETGPLEFE